MLRDISEECWCLSRARTHFGCSAQMSFLEELAQLTGEDLVAFLLRDDIPCPEVPVDENSLMEDWSLIEPEVSYLGGVVAVLWFKRFGSLLSKMFFCTAPG